MPTKYVVCGPHKLKDVDGKDRSPGDAIDPHPDYVDMLIAAGHIEAGTVSQTEKGDG